MRTTKTLLVATSATMLAGCPKNSTPTPADAGAGALDAAAPAASAAPKRPTGDRTIRVVAHADDYDTRLAVVGGRIMVVAGSAVYEARPDGELSMLGGAAAWAPVFSDDENLVGYGQQYSRVTGLADDGAGGVLLHAGKTFRAKGEKLEVVGEKGFGRGVPFQGKVLVDRMDPNTGLTEIAWLDGSKEGVPQLGITVRALAATKTGLVAIGTSKKDPSFHAVVVKADGSVEDTRLQTNGRPSCDFLTAFDDGTYLRCGSVTKGKEQQQPKIHKLEGTTFKDVFGDVDVPDGEGPMAIDDEGALWAAAKKGVRLVRCRGGGEKGGACTPVDVPEPKGVEHATVQRRSTDAMESSTMRYWETIDVATRTGTGKDAAVRSIVARSVDDVWLTLSTADGPLVAHSGAARPVAILPSDVGVRLTVRNTKPPARWIGHCEQVFVRIAGARGDKVLDVEAAKKRLPDVKAALAVVRRDDEYYGPPFGWALVEGTLADERVTGVVVYRGDAEASLERMETAVQKLVDKLTTDPVTKPVTTCTLPVVKTRLGGSDPG